jgi:iduronate 2-sulfatase
MSFLTGRYPHHTLTWNFVNHFRQAVAQEIPGASLGAGAPYKTLAVTDGGAGQCSSFCAAEPAGACAAWTMADACELYAAVAAAPAPRPKAVSGLPGTDATRAWTSLPQHFLNAGYLTLQTGKVFHTEEGGNGPAPWDGPASGMPPLQDPPSWSRGNWSMANVNALAPMRGCDGGGSGGCSVNATAEGDVAPDTFSFCDRTIGDDAVLKLGAAAANRAATGQPFYLAVGFRKPHLPFRHPAPWDDLYPPPAAIPLAEHKTLDPSVPPIAFYQTSLAQNPYAPLPDAQAGTLRRDYYAAISWVDSQIGRVLAALDAAGLANDTAVVFHADHGWSLGEHGQWEKFTVWEHGTRVPLVIRAPWVAPAGATTAVIAQLVDVFPTVAELAGIPAPPAYGLDGASLVPVLVGLGGARAEGAQAPHAASSSPSSSAAEAGSAADAAPPPPPPSVGAYALSVYPRCPSDTVNASNFWRDNSCLMTERTAFPFMGLSLRTDGWRYTEWRVWNGSALAPDWTAPLVGVELYNHTGDTEATFDGPWEQVNVAGAPGTAEVQAALAAQLAAVYPRGSLWPA